MRTALLLGAVLVLTAAGCSDSDEETTGSSATVATAAVSPSPSAGGAYVAAVNALCAAMIPGVMAVRGDTDGDGGGDLPAMSEFAAQEAQVQRIAEEFDAKVDALPVADADRAAADAFNAYRDASDAAAARTLAAAEDGDSQAYDASLEPSAEFETGRQALNAVGIDCPAR